MLKKEVVTSKFVETLAKQMFDEDKLMAAPLIYKLTDMKYVIEHIQIGVQTSTRSRLKS